MTAANWPDFVPPVAAAVAAGLALLLESRTRMLAALFGVYGAVAWQLAGSVPFAVALARAAIGAATVLILARGIMGQGIGRRPASSIPIGRAFRAAAIFLTLIPVSGIWGIGVLGALPIGQHQGLGSLWVMGLGALQVGLATGVERRAVGLLTLIAGFEILYAPLEPSLALTALLATVHLGLALVTVQLTSSLEGNPIR